MKMVLTRLGEGARMVVTGDPTQVDLLNPATPAWPTPSASWKASRAWPSPASTADDVVRHPLVERIVRAYDADAAAAAATTPAMIEVEVEDAAWTDGPARRARPWSCARPPGRAVALGRQAAAMAVAVLLTDDATVRDLNARFRGKDKPTNVLSFPAPRDRERHLGDVALAYGVCAREAAEQGKPLARPSAAPGGARRAASSRIRPR